MSCNPSISSLNGLFIIISRFFPSQTQFAQIQFKSAFFCASCELTNNLSTLAASLSRRSTVQFVCLVSDRSPANFSLMSCSSCLTLASSALTYSLVKSPSASRDISTERFLFNLPSWRCRFCRDKRRSNIGCRDQKFYFQFIYFLINSCDV